MIFGRKHGFYKSHILFVYAKINQSQIIHSYLTPLAAISLHTSISGRATSVLFILDINLFNSEHEYTHVCVCVYNIYIYIIGKMKRSFFPAAVMSILLYGCTTWTQTKRMEKKLDGNYTRMLRVILSKSWRQHPTKQQLYGHLPPISNTIKIRRIRHAEHCWRSWDELISDVFLWTPSHSRAKAERPVRNYIQ